MFGGPAGYRHKSPLLQNAVKIALSEKGIGDAWENKLDVMSFTCAALNNKTVRHKIILNDDGKALMKILTRSPSVLKSYAF